MRQFCKNGGLALLLDGFLRIFLERSGHGVGILCFEKHKVTILTFGLKGGKVDAVFPGNLGERSDVFISNFDTLHPLILGSKLFHSHPTVKLFGLLLGLHLPDMIYETVNTIGSATVPLSMLVVGIQLGSSKISRVIGDRHLVITSLVKMILWPVLTFLAVNWLPVPITMKIAMVFGAAFPTAVAVVAITSMENRNAVLAAETIAFTTLLSIITLPVSALLLMGYYGLV